MERRPWSRVGLGLAVAVSAAGAVPPSRAGKPAVAERVQVVIAATTDVHGRLRGWDYYANAPDSARSLAAAATIVDSLRRAHPQRVVLVDAGDLLQGNPLLFVAARVAPPPVHPAIAAMNVMRYDAAVIGNHEFNYGVPHLSKALSHAGFPFLGANIRRADGGAFVAPFTVVERRGVRIGIVGATTPGAMVWDREHLRAARLEVTDIVPAVRQAVTNARRQRADLVVVLLHAGLDEPASYDTIATGLPSENVAARVAREIDGIDLIVYGHSHKTLVDSTINRTLLVQPRNWAASVAVATFTLERARRSWQVVARRGQAVTVAGHTESETVVAASDGTHRATLAWVNAPVGQTAMRWSADSARVADLPITDLVGEVMRREAGADLAVTAAFSLDASLEAGQITAAMVARLYPYDNTLRAVRVSGAQLRAFLEHASRHYKSLTADGRVPDGGIVDPAVPGFNFDILSGADYTIDLRQPLGLRITRLEFRGRRIAPTDSFTLALNNYRHSGGGGYAMLSGAPLVYEKETDIRQLVIDHVRRAGIITPAMYATRNWELVPSIAVAAAYAEQARGRSAEAGGSAPRVPPARADTARRDPTRRDTASSAARGARPQPLVDAQYLYPMRNNERPD